MSYYNHMHDSKGRKETCTECKKDFTWVDHGNVYPGGKDREYITCCLWQDKRTYNCSPKVHNSASSLG
mgnify:CR=1 FL=1